MSRRLSVVAVPSETRTHCPYCAFQCGMVITSGKDVATTIRADPEFPVNRGQMCIKGFTSAALLDHPERVTTPLVRNAQGRLEPASWDEALSRVIDGIRRIQATHGNDAVAAFGSGALTNEKAYLLGKFARIALRSSQIDYNGRYCMASGAAGQNRAFGIDRGLPFPVSDIAQTRTLVLWGSNCADTLPPLMQWVTAQRESGASIVVDPRRTETARGATLHLQITPGSDLALANGLLHLAIEQGLIDREYIDARTVGFDHVRRKVLEFPPARVERITGVSASDMQRAIDLIAKSESAMILSGRGPEQQSKGADTVSALCNLMLALGKVGKPYSGYGTLTGQGNGQGGREHGQKADQLPGYRLIERESDREAIAAVWGVAPESLPRKGRSAYELLDAMGKKSSDGVQGLLVFGSNVAVASPNAASIEKKLSQLELLVVADAFLNETSAHAHVVLPVTQWAEETGTTTNFEGRVILRRKMREAPAGARSDLAILCDLAERLGVGDKFTSSAPEEVFEELGRATSGATADYHGMTHARLDREQGVFWPCPDSSHPGTPRLFGDRFHHPDGKARFITVDHRPAGEEPDSSYPLWFTTGRYKEHYNSGAQTRRVGELIDAQPEPRVQVHPWLARRLGIGDGERLLVESRRGSVVFRIALSTEVRPDTLFAPFHWGGRQAANLLTNPALDPTSRMPEFKVCAVRARIDGGSSHLRVVR
ncbi:molybdopterin oxidoreductase family protein [Sandaracinus amylolyticus]|uniref:molybdopterin oxidoreductase family protein n=1 Tax=Sandaracinus amylolyticus TaxID=927083 RepID=UPI001F431F80|nr:molybdopterin oxidoreductase family protein [Sandaracinus amylolyticus]UJR87139.1 Hypothetical protein I5071_92400 [Sandaracinus amylolyticus]